MSRITERADRTLENAAKARGQWMPDPDSRHYQLYIAFHTRKGLSVPKRGRCEYFHKVIRQAFYEARRFFLGLLLVLLSSGLLYLFLEYPGSMLVTCGVLLAVGYLVCGMFLSAHIAARIFPDNIDSSFPVRWYDKLSKLLQVLIAVLVAPAALVMLALLVMMAVIGGVVWFIGALLSVFDKPARWFFFEQPFGRRGFIWIRPWMLVAIAAVIVVAFTVPGFVQAVYMPVLWIVGIVVVIVCAFSLAFLIDAKLTDRRRSAKSEREKQLVSFVANRAVRQLFLYSHPEYLSGMDEEKFAAWLVRYRGYCERVYSEPYDQLEFWVHFHYVNAWKYIAMFDEYPGSLERRLREEFDQLHPAAVAKSRRWYHTVIELMALVWAWMRAAKQRVCPIVIYPPASDEA
ncbi:MAG: hypothetical protein WBP12_02770 [Candidatus Saccharimonas sp.]